MRISFDLDDTLICYGSETLCERRLPFLFRFFLRDEPLRSGATELLKALAQRGHELWIYTTSGRSATWIWWWFRVRGIPIHGIVNELRHRRCFGQDCPSTKRPDAFGIDIHVDNSAGVAEEGRRHGFNVCVVNPAAADWVQHVLKSVEERAQGNAQ